MRKNDNSNKHVHKVQFDFGSEQIQCEIQFGNRNRLKIIVYPDLRVVIYAPSTISLSQVLEKAKQRAGWIIKQKTFFEQFIPRQPERKFVSGESFYYLGRQYRLKVTKSDIETAKLIGRFLRVQTRDRTETSHVKSQVDMWYRQHAKKVFERRLDICLELAKRYEIPRPELKIRSMQRRWGSCKGSENILLNTQLVKAPLRCIDYVIIHELCHLKHASHCPKFYQLLSRLLPDWKERKQRLEYVTL